MVRCGPIVDGNVSWPSAAINTVAYGKCEPGFTANPTPNRLCNSDGEFSPVINNPCQPIEACQADTYLNSQWLTTPGGKTAYGTCNPGWTGNPTRACEATGQWSTDVVNYCTRITCPAVTYDGFNWPKTNSLTDAVILCGTSGNYSRYCNATGQFGDVVIQCETCPATADYGNAAWSATYPKTTATGICKPGYHGSPQRICNPDAVWQTLVTHPCQVIMCPAFNQTADFVYWPEMYANDEVKGDCYPGYTGAPKRTCSINGVPSGNIGTPCV